MGTPMNRIEAWYLKRFRPADDGYLFTQWGHDVHLSAEEVAALMAEWRGIWLNPFLWGGWLALGVALPGWLYLRGSGIPAFMVALLFGVMMLVTLAYAYGRANELAKERVPIKAVQSFRTGQPTWPAALVMAVLTGQWLLNAQGIWFWAFAAAFVFSTAILLRTLWRWWRARSVAA